MFFVIQIISSYSQVKQQNPQIDKIDVLHYDFDIKLTDANDIIEVYEAVSIRFMKSTNSFFLDLKNKESDKGMSVIEVLNGDAKIKFKHINDRLYFKGHWEKDSVDTFKISFKGIPADGLIISKNKKGKRTFFGDNWPNRAHNWLCVIDHPSDKASVDFTVRAPSHYEVIANGILVEKVKINDEFNRISYSTGDVPLATKVMVIGVADFDIKNYGNIYGIPISSWVFNPVPKGGLDDYISAMDIMKFYTDSIGKYSYHKLANVQSKTRYGGMENAGNIFYYEGSVNGRHQVEPLVAHEVAHQWFGNSVSEKSWYDIWLSEGFATYLTDMYLEFKYGEQRLMERMKTERKKVIRYNSRISKSVIDTTVTDWNKLLNPNSYEKAAWFLHMLRNKIGTTNFYSLLRNYYKRYKNSNALTKDFRAIAEQVSNENLKLFFNQWLIKPGHPKLNIDWQILDTVLYVKIVQNKDLFYFDLPIRIVSNKNLLDFTVHVSSYKDVYALPVNSSFDDANTKLTLDPKVILLHEAKVLHSKNMEIKFPVIQGSDFLQEGDLLFQDLDCGPLCDAIESVTFGLDSAHFSHVGIVSKKKNGKVLIAEAMGNAVREVDLSTFLDRYKDKFNRPKVVVGRLNDESIIKNSIINLKKYIGKPYDDVFSIKNDRYYCSELVYFTFKDNKGESVFSLLPMNYKDKATDKYFESWVEYFKKLNTKIPQGQQGINPGGISRSSKIIILYKYGNPEGW